MNTAVTATGMSVTAKTEGGVAIAAYTKSGSSAVAPDSNAFASSAAAVYNASATIAPTSFSGSKWYTAKAANANGYEAESGTYTEVTTLDSYRLISKFQVKSMDTNSNDSPVSLYVTDIDVTGNTNSTVLNKSLRVIVNIGGTYVYFAPLYDSAFTGNLYFYNGTQRTAKAVDSAIYIDNSTLAAGVKVIDSALTTAATDVEIYVYYEGEDDNCKSINAVNIDTLTIKITFATTVS